MLPEMSRNTFQQLIIGFLKHLLLHLLGGSSRVKANTNSLLGGAGVGLVYDDEYSRFRFFSLLHAY